MGFWAVYMGIYGAGTAPATASPTTRLALVGASRERLDLTGTSRERYNLKGTSQERLNITGSSNG